MAMAGLECVFCLGCTRWAWKRCTYVGSYDSETWPTATPSEFEPIPHVTRIVLAVYEPDLSNPRLLPPNAVDPAGVVKRASYADTGGLSPPYLIYADRPNNQIVFAVRGLNIVNNADYKLLLDNKLGGEMFDGGYVHRGLLSAAKWLLETETGTLRRLVEEMGKDVRVVFAGHSLGSGIAALMTVLVVNDTAKIGGVPRKQIRGYAIAPARCMSLNLSVKYADVIHSVILQDDFLPRTATPLEDIFKSIFCLPCLIFFVCMRDTFIPEGRKLRDPRRLYAPGRMYHIVERKFCRCGRYPPEVRTAIPVEGRFEHIVLSKSVTKDHAIGWIVREVEKAWEIMKESGEVATPPPEQRMERMQTIKKEHEDALERAVSLKIPHAVTLVDAPSESMQVTAREDKEEDTSSREAKSDGKISWDDVVEKLFRRSASGNLVFKHEIDSSEQ